MTAATTASVVPSTDLAGRYGVSVERDGRYVRVDVPPVARLGLLHRGYVVWIAVLLATMVLVRTRLVGESPDRRAFNVLMPLFLYGGPALIVAAVAYVRLHRWAVFVVTAEEFVLYLRTAPFAPRRSVWNRRDILRVEPLANSGKLYIRVRGEEAVEVYLSPTGEVARAVAGVLEEALKSEFERGELPDVFSFAAGNPRRTKLAIAGSIGLLVVSVVLLCMPEPYAIFGHYLFILSAVPVGIAFGVQRKEFWI